MTAAASQPAATGRLTRVTMVGPRQRVDLVLPSEEPVGVLLPELVAMMGRSPADDPRAYQISLLGGRVLEPNANLRGAGVTDGTLLRLDPLTDAPPAPIVHDVSDEVADDLSRRRGRWGDRPRRWTATATVTAAAAMAAGLAGGVIPAVLLVVTGAVMLVAATVIGVLGARAIGVALVLAGAATDLVALGFWPMGWPAHAALWTLTIALAGLALGIAAGQLRAGVLAAGTVLGLLGLWTLLFALGLSVGRVSAVMAVVSVGMLGLLPRLAMMTSGLTRLDDRQSNDEPVPRAAAMSIVDAAHRGLALASVPVAVSGALAGWSLAQAGSAWTVAMACLVGIALLLRFRAFPLTAEVVSMVAAALVVTAGLIEYWMRAAPALWWAGVACALVVAVLGLVALGYDAPPHVRARARQIADRAEGLAVVALVPVAVGVFDVYTKLLHTF
jgi:type VII secretion integral membrane protein EccD